ncbi:MAG: hypothetical protein ABIR66_07130 [Saprospiraceae bacterium]
MWIEFDQLPEDSRIWIFSIDGEMQAHKHLALKEALMDFILDWTSHQQSLKASASIIDDRFIIIGLDQSQYGASGCSIDKLMRLIQKLELKTGLGLLLKNKIAIQHQNMIQWKTLSEIKQANIEGSLDEKSVYFDTMIDSVYLFKNYWIKPLNEGWLGKKLFK